MNQVIVEYFQEHIDEFYDLKDQVESGEEIEYPEFELVPREVRLIHKYCADLDTFNELSIAVIGSGVSESTTGEIPWESVDRAANTVDAGYYCSTNDFEKRIIRTISQFQTSYSSVSALLSRMATMYRGASGPVRPVLAADKFNFQTYVPSNTQDIVDVGPYYFRHLFEANKFTATTVAVPGGETVSTIGDLELTWVAGGYDYTQVDELTEALSTYTEGTKKLRMFNCDGLTAVHKILLNTLVLEPKVSGGFQVRPRTDEVSPGMSYARGGPFTRMMRELNGALIDASDALSAHNLIQYWLYTNRTGTAQHWFSSVDKTIDLAVASADATTGLMKQALTSIVNPQTAHMFQVKLENSKGTRNAGNNVQVFRGNASPYGFDMPDMAEYARYVTLAHVLKTRNPSSDESPGLPVVCFTSQQKAQVLHLHDALSKQGVKIDNWQAATSTFAAMSSVNLAHKIAIFDSTVSEFPSKDLPMPISMSNALNAMATVPTLASAYFHFKTADLLKLNATGLQGVSTAVPEGVDLFFFMGGKFHVSHMWGLAVRTQSEMTASAHYDNILGAALEAVRISYCFEVYTAAAAEWGIQLEFGYPKELVDKVAGIIENNGLCIVDVGVLTRTHSGKGFTVAPERINSVDRTKKSVLTLPAPTTQSKFVRPTTTAQKALPATRARSVLAGLSSGGGEQGGNEKSEAPAESSSNVRNTPHSYRAPSSSASADELRGSNPVRGVEKKERGRNVPPKTKPAAPSSSFSRNTRSVYKQ